MKTGCKDAGLKRFELGEKRVGVKEDKLLLIFSIYSSLSKKIKVRGGKDGL